MKLIFAGTPANAARSLRTLAAKHDVALVITREDAPIGRKREVTPSPVAQVAAELGLTTLKRNRLSAEDAGLISKLEASVAVVVAYGALIPKSLLEILPWWNLHFSTLPNWRGATPLQHSMLWGGEGAGITLFELEAGLDTGPILALRPMKIDFDKTCGELLDEFTDLGSDMILKALDERPTPNAQSGEASLAPKISREQARLDLSLSADQLAWKVMALNPEPMAWCELEGNPIRILRASSLGATNWNSLDGHAPTPGLVRLSENRVLVECGNGTRLELKELQPAGKKVMAALDWYRGLNREIELD